MLKFLHFNKETVDAAEAAMPDRVGMYNSCHLANLPGMSNGTWVDVGAGMAPLLREGGDNVDMYTGGVHVVHFHAPAAAAAAQQQEEAPSSWGAVAVTEHVVTGSANTTSAIDTVGVAKGTADVVTVCHGLVAEAA